jgi:homogentisate 1,2-dioxygenase
MWIPVAAYETLDQMLLAAYDYNDWILIIKNTTNFSLDIVNISIYILFNSQYYVLHKDGNGNEINIIENGALVVAQNIGMLCVENTLKLKSKRIQLKKELMVSQESN